jgi:hypothetical protein
MDSEIQELWIQYPNMDRPLLDYIGVRDLFFPLVHPGHDEVVNGDYHAFVNLAILPDWLLNDDLALKVLELK